MTINLSFILGLQVSFGLFVEHCHPCQSARHSGVGLFARCWKDLDLDLEWLGNGFVMKG